MVLLMVVDTLFWLFVGWVGMLYLAEENYNAKYGYISLGSCQSYQQYTTVR